MKTIVRVHGELAQRLGRSQWRVKIDSPGEAVSAIEAITGGIHAYLRENLKSEFVFLVNGEEIQRSDELVLQHHGETLRSVDIMPVAEGSGSKLEGGLMVLVGAILLIASIAIPGLAPALSKVGMTLGLGLMLSGITSMLAPTLDEQPEAKLLPSHLFDGAVNTMRQGNPVPFGAGMMEIGSQTISFGVYARAIDAEEAPRRRVQIISDPGDASLCAIVYSALTPFLAGDRFGCYPLTVDTLSLEHGNGFTESWDQYRFGAGIIAADDFEAYAPATRAGYLADIGEDWTTRWRIFSDNVGTITDDNMESYIAQAVDMTTEVLFGGSNWDAAWGFFWRTLEVIASEGFASAALGTPNPGELTDGEGWSAGWVWFIRTLGAVSSDTFAAEATGYVYPDSPMENGTGWSVASTWSILSLFWLDHASDLFGDYNLESPNTQNLSGGAQFSTAWTVYDASGAAPPLTINYNICFSGDATLGSETAAYDSTLTANSPYNGYTGQVGVRVQFNRQVRITELCFNVVSGNSGTTTLRLYDQNLVELASISVDQSLETAGIVYKALAEPVLCAPSMYYYIVQDVVSGGDYYQSLNNWSHVNQGPELITPHYGVARANGTGSFTVSTSSNSSYNGLGFHYENYTPAYSGAADWVGSNYHSFDWSEGYPTYTVVQRRYYLDDPTDAACFDGDLWLTGDSDHGGGYGDFTLVSPPTGDWTNGVRSYPQGSALLEAWWSASAIPSTHSTAFESDAVLTYWPWGVATGVNASANWEAETLAADLSVSYNLFDGTGFFTQWTILRPNGVWSLDRWTYETEGTYYNPGLLRLDQGWLPHSTVPDVPYWAYFSPKKGVCSAETFEDYPTTFAELSCFAEDESFCGWESSWFIFDVASHVSREDEIISGGATLSVNQTSRKVYVRSPVPRFEVSEPDPIELPGVYGLRLMSRPEMMTDNLSDAMMDGWEDNRVHVSQTSYGERISDYGVQVLDKYADITGHELQLRYWPWPTDTVGQVAYDKMVNYAAQLDPPHNGMSNGLHFYQYWRQTPEFPGVVSIDRFVDFPTASLLVPSLYSGLGWDPSSNNDEHEDYYWRLVTSRLQLPAIATFENAVLTADGKAGGQELHWLEPFRIYDGADTYVALYDTTYGGVDAGENWDTVFVAALGYQLQYRCLPLSDSASRLGSGASLWLMNRLISSVEDNNSGTSLTTVTNGNTSTVSAASINIDTSAEAEVAFGSDLILTAYAL